MIVQTTPQRNVAAQKSKAFWHEKKNAHLLARFKVQDILINCNPRL